MKFCPKCGNVVNFNTYFGAEMCTRCNWEDNTYRKQREERIREEKIFI